MRRPPFREELKRWGYLILFLYLVLLAMSHFYIHDKGLSAVPAVDPDKKVVEVEGQRLAYLEWGGASPNLAPLILLHGSPSSGARDWEKFATELAASGRRVIAIDRWGFGDSERRVDDYSFEADKKAVLGLMDQLGIRKAHVGGWSYGGGPAILLGETERNRILSIALIASLGIQEGEGSGSHLVEHWKYSALNVIANWLPEIIPHFGLLGSRSSRRSFARDFMDCDQRPLRSRLTTMATPVLIIHGKHDPLIPAWVAQEHHHLKPTSRLVVLDSSHFFPFGFGSPGNLKIAAEETGAFLAAAEAGKASERYGIRNETSRRDLRALWDGGPALRGYKPWWMIVLGGLAVGFFVPRSGAAIVGLAGGLLVLDPLTAVIGVVLGGIVKREEFRTRFHKAGAIALLGGCGALLGAVLLPWF